MQPPQVTPPSLAEIRAAMARFATPLVLLGLALAIYIGFGFYNRLYVDYLWFESLGQSAVFWTVNVTPVLVGLAGAGAVLVFLSVNLVALLWVLRQAQVNKTERLFLLLQHDEPAPIRPGAIYGLVKWAGVAVVGLLTLIGGATASGWWQDVLFFMHARSFGQLDPILGHDVGFYIFKTPLLREATDFSAGYVYLTLLLVGGLYATIYFMFVQEAGRRLTNRPTALMNLAARHVLALVALVFLISFAHAQLSNWSLAVSGPTYVQANINIAMNSVLGPLALLIAAGAVILAVSGRPGGDRKLRLAAGTYVGWLGLILVSTVAAPTLIQTVQVTPSELSFESRYIAYRLAATRSAFQLDRIRRIGLDSSTSPTLAELQANPGTIANVRILDSRKLHDTTVALQGIRSYYTFSNSVAIDRYNFGGQVLQQVMTMARELNTGGLPGSAQSWQSITLQYTHGFGVAMAAVNHSTAEGLPDYVISNIPPLASVPVPLDHPQIYYGQTTSNYVIVNSGIDELDYSGPSGDVYARYQGKSGVTLDSSWKKLNFAARFNEPNIVLSHYVTPGSRILYHRAIADRVAMLAPFLTMDPDPYVVVSGGRLVYMWDGYTTSSLYPYSDHFSDPNNNIDVNYMRNSVKVVIDAYDGSIHFYVADASDPMVQAYRAIYPTLFSDLSAMPAGLRAHVRYPEELFMAQADRYSIFHVRDPQVYFNQGDRWAFPQEQLGPTTPSVIMAPYYVTVKLPKVTEGAAEFVQMLPLTPLNKGNMIAWLAARMDAPHYGELVEIDLPRGANIFGPAQIGARIQQNTFISSQITLLSQQGSGVGLGNLLVLPIDQGFLYVQPLYVQATGAAFPELKAVIVANNEDVQMASSLGEAINQLYGLAPRNQPLQSVAAPCTSSSGACPSPSPSPSPQSPSPSGPSPSPVAPGGSSLSGLVADANRQFQLAQQAAGRGDFIAYGRALQQLQADLAALQQLNPH